MKDFYITDPEVIDEQLINEKLLDHDEVRVQFSKPIYTAATLSQLDEIAAANSSKFTIRFYSKHKTQIDCEILDYIPNVKSLAIDCTDRVKNIANLRQLNYLEKLTIGIYEIEDLDILSYDNLKKVKKLSIGETKSKALNLQYLENYSDLTNLQIVGHTRNINSIAHLKQLQTLSLNSISKVPLDFINHLKSLKILRIILGSRSNINEILNNSIENLDIVWIKGFNDLSGLNNLKNLKNLLIDREIQLKEIIFSELPYLEDVKLLQCKTLQTIRGIDKLAALKGFRISESLVDIDNFLTMKFPDSLNTLAFYTWKSKQDKIIRQKLDNMGFNEFGSKD